MSGTTAATLGAIQAITVPRWGMTMTEGKLVGWLVPEGSPVKPGDEIVEIETSKITNVVEAAAAGLMRRHVAPAGATLPCGSLLGVIAPAEVGDAEIDAFVAAHEGPAAEEEAGGEARAPRLVEAGGQRINVLTAGPAEAGEPVMLVHGFGGQINTWLFNQDALADALGTAVHAMDLPGHGGSATDVGNGGVAALAAALGHTLDALDATRVHLVGHSLGGAVCLAFAQLAPDRVMSLTLIAPLGLGDRVSAAYVDGYLAAERRPAMKAALEQLFADPGLVSRQMVEDSLSMKRTDGVAPALARIAAVVMPTGTQAFDGRGILAALQVPAQTIWGVGDVVIPPAAEAPGGVEAHRVEGAGHMPHMERAGEVNALIEALIRRAG